MTPTSKVLLRRATKVTAVALSVPVVFGQTTERVSVSSVGTEANGSSDRPSAAADGRYIAFHSYATNLVDNESNGKSDIFVHDRQTHQTTRVSVSSSGEQANGASFYASISATGRYVSYHSFATNLVDNDLASTASVSSAGRHPSACVDGSGRRVVVWSAPGAAGDLDVLMQRFDSGGLSMGPQARVNATTAGDQVGPSVACRADGSFVVTWASTTGSLRQGAGIFGRLFSSGGTPTSPDLPLNELPFGDAVTTRVATRPTDGGFFAVWQGTPSTRQGGSGIFGRLFTSSGGAGSPQIAVDPPGAYVVSFPAVGVNDSGDGAVAWSREGADGWNDVYLRRYTASGAPVGSEVRVNQDLFRDQEHPAVVVDDDGAVLVAWQGPSLPDAGGYRRPGADVFARRFDPAGSPIGSVFRVNSTADGSQRSPRAVRNLAGDCFVGWEQEGSSGSVGVFGRHLQGCVSLLGDDVRVSAAGGASLRGAAFALGGDGSVTAAYVGDDIVEGDGSVLASVAGAPETPIFADSFESGTTDAWSHTVP